MKFHNPYYLFFLILPLILLVKVIYDHHRRKGTIYISDISTLKASLPKSGSGKILLVPNFLKVFALAIMIIAIARPQFGTIKNEVKKYGIDIFLAMDVSGSMAAEDLKPNRLEVTKKVITKFLDKVGANRVGMVVFSGKPMTLMPLSLDFGVLIDSLKSIRLEEVPFGGTNIGDSISMCCYHLEKEKTKSKIVILLTDGENTPEIGYANPLAAAKIAKEKGIKVYTIGMGSEQGAPIPQNTVFGKRYARNRDGSLYIPKIDIVTLKTIAKYTGGQFFRATDEKTLEKIFENISKLEKSEIKTSRTTLYSEQAHIFMILAFGFFVAAILLECGPLRRLE